MRVGSRVVGLVVAGVLTLTAAGASAASVQSSGVPGSIGSIPPAASGPERAGTITWGELPGIPPDWIFPVASDAYYDGVNLQLFSWQMWRPLYWTENGVTPELVPAMSLADPPVYSRGDRTVSITLKSSYTWSDGTPVSADDVLFDIDLIRAAVKASPSNWGGYTPGNFPDNLAGATTPDASTLVLHLSQPVNPSFFTENVLGNLNPLPADAWARDSLNGPVITDWAANPAAALKVYDFLVGQSEKRNSYATNPLWQVVDGPYRLSSFHAASGGFTLVPNAGYGGPHAATMSTIEGVPFATWVDELDALIQGTVDVAFGLNGPGNLQSYGQIGYRYFGEPTFGYYLAVYNFKDATGQFGAIASQLYFRQAMAHLVDQPGWIRDIMQGEGDPGYGPIPAFPVSPYLPMDATTDPYPFSVQAAVTLLEDHGWTVTPGGTDVCANPGAGAGQCGAGISSGTRLAFNFAYAAGWPISGYAEDLATEALKAGIKISLQSTNFNDIVSNYNDVTTPANDDRWAMQDFGYEADNTYPTTFGFLNTGGPFQIGDYSNPTADAMINASVSGSDPGAVRNEAAFLTTNVPVLFEPNPDQIVLVKTRVSGPPASFENLTQYYLTPEFWYLPG